MIIIKTTLELRKPESELFHPSLFFVHQSLAASHVDRKKTHWKKAHWKKAHWKEAHMYISA